MKNKKVLIIILVMVVICLVGVFYVFSKKNTTDITSSSDIDNEISYDDTLVSFDDYDNFDVNLNDYSGCYDISSAGVYHITGSLNGYIKVDSTSNIKIILDNVTIVNDNGPAIYVASAKNTYIELVGESSVTDSKIYSNYEEKVNGAIFSSDDLFIMGSGKINVTANYYDGIVSMDDLTILGGDIVINSADDGIRGKDSVVINDGDITITSLGDGIKSTNDTDTSKGFVFISGGVININSTLDGISAYTNVLITGGEISIVTNGNSSTDSSTGIKGDNSIVIEQGVITIDSYDDAIHTNGDFSILLGDLTLSSSDDGVHADNNIIIDGGVINIIKSYEGLESANIVINGGEINISSSDDGVNVAYGNDSSSTARPGANTMSSSSNNLLTINGGYLYVDAKGDGLDANGSIVINDGIVIVDGPVDNGNGALDYDRSFTINGGTLIASSSSSMAQNASGGTQNTVMINFSSMQSANTLISISDVIAYMPSKSYSSVVISSPLLESNKSYNILVGGSCTLQDNKLCLLSSVTGGSLYQSFTVSQSINTVGNSNMGGMGGMRR